MTRYNRQLNKRLDLLTVLLVLSLALHALTAGLLLHWEVRLYRLRHVLDGAAREVQQLRDRLP